MHLPASTRVNVMYVSRIILCKYVLVLRVHVRHFLGAVDCGNLGVRRVKIGQLLRVSSYLPELFTFNKKPCYGRGTARRACQYRQESRTYHVTLFA